jgi:hypothetical protein
VGHQGRQRCLLGRRSPDLYHRTGSADEHPSATGGHGNYRLFVHTVSYRDCRSFSHAGSHLDAASDLHTGTGNVYAGASFSYTDYTKHKYTSASSPHADCIKHAYCAEHADCVEHAYCVEHAANGEHADCVGYASGQRYTSADLHIAAYTFYANRAGSTRR